MSSRLPGCRSASRQHFRIDARNLARLQAQRNHLEVSICFAAFLLRVVLRAVRAGRAADVLRRVLSQSLPEDAAQRCSGRVTIAVTRIKCESSVDAVLVSCPQLQTLSALATRHTP